MGNNYATLK